MSDSLSGTAQVKGERTANHFSALPSYDERAWAREALHARYEDRLVDKFGYRQLVTYVPNKTEPIHNWFDYKEGFSKKLVEGLLAEFDARPDELVLDPFCGCGTTPLTCQQLGYPAVGVDILDVAIFAARVKLRTHYEPLLLESKINQLLATPFREPEGAFPEIRIIPRAFTSQVMQQVLSFKEAILSEPEESVRDFLMLGLTSVLEEVSFTSKDGQFLRLVEREIPPVRQVLGKKLRAMHSDLLYGNGQRSFLYQAPNTQFPAMVLRGDARCLPLDHGSADIVITSPPYLNRYDYSRVYTLELALLFINDFEELKDVRHSLLRSHIEVKPSDTDKVRTATLREILSNLEGRKLNNPRIPIMIKGYFEDMFQVIKELYRVMRPGGCVALVVGNARFAGEIVPVDMMLCELAEQAGFHTRAIWVTRYKGNSSQQMGRYGRRPVRESIILWRK